MNDKELLLSISNMMDTKLNSLEERMDAKLNSLEERMDVKFDSLERRLETKIDALGARVENLEVKVDALDTRVDNLTVKVNRTNLLVDNQVLPRIKEIESCYLSTFERYQQETSRIGPLQLDVSVIKDVLIEHGEKIKSFQVCVL